MKVLQISGNINDVVKRIDYWCRTYNYCGTLYDFMRQELHDRKALAHIRKVANGTRNDYRR